MIKQQSFKNNQATLYLVATPIGNLNEMTPRALEILAEVDLIAAEDTRTTKKLLHHFNIDNKCVSHHLHNENESAEGIVELLKTHDKIALVSDAGYPLISDPGQKLVKRVIEAGFNVVPVSGASAFLNALVASGLVVQPFAFMGFLEAKEQAIRNQLENIKKLEMTTVYYLSVHKLEKTLGIVYDVLGDRQICLVRELTKMHEEFIRGSVTEVQNAIEVIKGEFVLVIEGYHEAKEQNFEMMKTLIDEAIANGNSVSRSISKIAKENNISKNELYAYYHDMNQNDKGEV